jgi:hypothetical protein
MLTCGTTKTGPGFDPERAHRPRIVRVLPRRVLAGATVLLVCLAPFSALADKMDVELKGVKVGELDVSTYTIGKGAGGNTATGNIIADFTKTGIGPGGEDLLFSWFPQGLTYMQTVMFMFDSGKQQQIFRRGDGGDLKGKFSDPPQGGYTLRSGAKAFAGDKFPWYSTIEPSMVPGAIPPNRFDGHQFQDEPTIGFDDVGVIDGLTDLLMGMNGMLAFEAALVGVKKGPKVDDPRTPEDERLTGTYEVMVLKAFTWGFTFTFMDDGVPGLTADDYKVDPKPLVLSAAVSGEFFGAFDKRGDNADIEWRVIVPLPLPLALLGSGLAVLLAASRSRRGLS